MSILRCVRGRDTIKYQFNPTVTGQKENIFSSPHGKALRHEDMKLLLKEAKLIEHKLRMLLIMNHVHATTGTHSGQMSHAFSNLGGMKEYGVVLPQSCKQTLLLPSINMELLLHLVSHLPYPLPKYYSTFKKALSK